MSTPGQPASIGPYTVLRELGRGGMGVVYLAHDPKLDRDIAIKALPAHLAQDPDRLARFQREAKVLASLNHPGIAAIYGLEEVAGTQYLVLEYVDGETLADRLNRGPIPVDEALTLARHIAEALEAAHEKGVVHRDLKPGNVMVSSEGKVKVLDFGLARSGDGSPSSTNFVPAGSSPNSPHSPTITAPPPVHSPTIAGAIMGTAGYMSPEQARGRAVDKRSDIFSFGCVLFEMLSGKMPFSGETVADSMGATLHKEHDVALLPATVPPRIRELLGNCLAKDRGQRLHDIGDARLELERAINGREWVTAAARSSQPTTLVKALVAITAAVALVGIGWLAANRGAAHSPGAAKLNIPSRTSAYRFASNPVISPDGRSVVFSARPTGAGTRGLWVRAIDSFESRPLAETKDAQASFWSPDGRSIGFVADNKVWSIDVAQGGSRRLIAAVQGISSACWGADGTILVATWNGAELISQILSVPESGGKLEPVLTAQPKHYIHSVSFLPDGKRFWYVDMDFGNNQEVRIGRLCAGRLRSTDRTDIMPVTSPTWYVEPGWLVYVEDGTIKAASFDLTSLKVTGPAITIADDVRCFRPTGDAALSVAPGGAMVYTTPEDEQQLVWFDAAGTRLGTIGPKSRFSSPRISPDGTRVATGLIDRRTGLVDLWIYGVDRPTSTRLTTDARWEDIPVWSHDGATIYFSTDWDDYPEIYSIRADGSGEIKKIYGPGSGGKVWFARSASPDGKSLLVSGVVDKLDDELRVIPLDGPTPGVPFRSSPASEASGRFSPDGRWLAYQSNESGKSEVYVAAYPGPGSKVQVSDGGYLPVWGPKGDKLYYIQAASSTSAETIPSRIMVVDLDKPESFTSPPAPRVLLENTESIDTFDVAPDGKRFLVHLSPLDSPALRVILNGLPAPTDAASPAKKR